MKMINQQERTGTGWAVVFFSLFSAALFGTGCRGDGADAGGGGGGGGSSCQSCLDDYCDCVDGVSDTQVLIDCGDKAGTCANSQCTSAEAQNLDYNSCGTGLGSDEGNSGDGKCEACIDAFCTCIDGTTDTQVMASCADTANSCASAECTATELAAMDYSCTSTGEGAAECQSCIDGYCGCLAGTGDAGCTNTYTSCVQTACTEDIITQVDLSCLQQI